MAKKAPAKKQKIVAPPSSVYRRIAFSFIGAALVLLAVVLYVSLARATVVIHPKKGVLTANLALDANGSPGEGEIKAEVKAQTVELAKTFTLSGNNGKTVSVPATGTVTVKNTTSKAQPLVRTTRLLATTGQLFHIDKTVTVPAQGTVTVGIYADVPGPAGEIGPSHFTIPGLWEGLRDKIFADSTTPTSGGMRTVRTVTQEDITNAETELGNGAIAQVQAALRALVPNAKMLGGEAFLSTVQSRTSDAKVGAEVDSFTERVKVQVTGVFYDRMAVEAAARTALENLTGADRELASLDSSDVMVTVDRADVAKGTARLTVGATGTLALRAGSSIRT